MAGQAHRKTGQKRRRGREAKRLARDRKILAKLRLLVAEAERRHAQFDEPVEALSVFYGKETRPASWELSPFPMGEQVNGRPMPQWEDLSQWMKVSMATVVCHEWELLTFNINLQPDLEAELVATGEVRQGLSERVRKHVSRSLGPGREYFFVIEGHSNWTGLQTHLHVHGACAARDGESLEMIEDVLCKAAGYDMRGRGRPDRASKSKWFQMVRAAYMNYLFKFTLRRDPRLDERRLVMSRAMTQAARDFWNDIARPDLG